MNNVPGSTKRKKALIIGTSLGVSEHLINENYYVCDISKEDGANTKHSEHYSCDITNWEDIKKILKEVKDIDCLIFAHRLSKEESGDLKKEFELMVNIPSQMIDFLCLNKQFNNESSIIFIGSDASDYITDQPLGYHVSRAGIVQMTRYYAYNLADKKIRVNCISPCKIDKGYINDVLISKIPLRRMCEVKDIFRAIDFCNECLFITGQNIILDGGSSLNLRLYNQGKWRKHEN